jgi:anti-sigma B factor antagonist
MRKIFFEIELSEVFDGTQNKLFYEKVNAALESDCDAILVNCEKVTFMDSSGLGSMISALKLARNAGKQFCICSINRQVNMLFNLTDTQKIFTIYPDRESFCDSN